MKCASGAFMNGPPAYSGLPSPYCGALGVRGLLTWGWEQGAAAAVITTVRAASPCVTRPLQTLTPSVAAGELAGATGICRHRGHSSALG